MNGIVLLLLVFLVSTPIAIEQETCNGNFDCDQDVDAFDVTTFLQDFGRGQYANPCPPCVPLEPVDKTGQTSCYDELGNIIDCTGTGQDGEYQMGYNRFTDNGDGTVTDNFTKLMWLKDLNCMLTHYPEFDTDDNPGDGLVEWQTALDFVRGINDGTYVNCSAGYNDWRTPNRRESQSIYVATESFNYLHPFVNTGSDSWTSTTHHSGRTLAYTFYGQAYKTESRHFAWAVRGGH